MPCFIWLDVEVSREIRHELTVLERFIIEAGVELGSFDERDIEEITSIPARIVRRFMLRLLRSGTAEVERGVFKVLPDIATRVLQQEFTSELKPAKLTFLYFPRTDDLIACPDDDDVRRILRLRPAFAAPVPQERAGKPVGDFLADRIEARTVSGLPRDIVRLSANDNLGDMPKLCQTWRASAQVRGTNEGLRLYLTFYGQSKKNPEHAEHANVQLRGAEGLTNLWVSLPQSLSDSRYSSALSEPLGLVGGRPRAIVALGPSRYAVRLRAADTQALFDQGICLSNARGLGLCASEFIAEVEVNYTPEQPESAHQFAIDRAVVILRNKQPSDIGDLQAAIVTACATENVSPNAARRVTTDAVLSRLWELEDFGIIYALRAQEDFRYEDPF